MENVFAEIKENIAKLALIHKGLVSYTETLREAALCIENYPDIEENRLAKPHIDRALDNLNFNLGNYIEDAEEFYETVQNGHGELVEEIDKILNKEPEAISEDEESEETTESTLSPEKQQLIEDILSLTNHEDVVIIKQLLTLLQD